MVVGERQLDAFRNYCVQPIDELLLVWKTNKKYYGGSFVQICFKIKYYGQIVPVRNDKLTVSKFVCTKM